MKIDANESDTIHINLLANKASLIDILTPLDYNITHREEHKLQYKVFRKERLRQFQSTEPLKCRLNLFNNMFKTIRLLH